MRPFCKGFSISDVAHPWHTENKLSSALAYSQHCIGFFSYCDKPAWVGSGGGNKV